MVILNEETATEALRAGTAVGAAHLDSNAIFLAAEDVTILPGVGVELPPDAWAEPASAWQIINLDEAHLFVINGRTELWVIKRSIPAYLGISQRTWDGMRANLAYESSPAPRDSLIDHIEVGKGINGIIDMDTGQQWWDRQDQPQPLEAGQMTADKPGTILPNGIKAVKTSAGQFWGWNWIYGKDKEYSTPLMLRAWIGRLRFHIFYRGDEDPDGHDHPWGFWTFPLRSYVEEVTEEYCAIEGAMPTREWRQFRQVVPAFRLSYRPAEHCHRVLGRFGGYAPWDWDQKYPTVMPGKVPTIVWRTGKKRDWGFLKNRDGRWCWVPAKRYIFEDGKSAPCE